MHCRELRFVNEEAARRPIVMATNRKTTKSAGAPADASPRPRKAAAPADASTLVDLAHQVRSWTDTVLGVAGAAADATLGAAKMMLPKPGQRAALEKTGAVLRRMRETAGMSVDEVGRAIDLKDPALLELVENGKVALPFEIILRLASVLGRNDPISFVMRFTRSYNPDVWKTLESLGIGRLALQAGREREFANLYRASDAARRLSDEDFAEVLKFTQAAFAMALAFRAGKAVAGPAAHDEGARR
jgi:transcriptional regulator with XRE-family HTH domain